MSILFNDNLNVSAPLPVDNRYGQTTDAGAASLLPFTPYASASAAHSAIPAAKKYVGLTVLVGTAPNIREFWYVDDPSNVDNLVPKILSIGGDATIVNPSNNANTKYTLVVGDYNTNNNQKFGLMCGRSNTFGYTGADPKAYGVALGNANYINGTASFAIGEGNAVTQGFCGSLGAYVDNKARLSTAIGYSLSIPEENINGDPLLGTFHCGIFNNPYTRDYNYQIDGVTKSYPILSVGSGDQGASNPSFNFNGLNLMRGGELKIRDGIDARYGKRGVCVAQWHTSTSYPNSWESKTGDKFFEPNAKYIIINYGFGIITGASGTAGTNIITGTLRGPNSNPDIDFANANVLVNATVEIISGSGKLVAQSKITYVNSGGTNAEQPVTFTINHPITTNIVNATIRIGDNFDNIIGDDSNIVWGSRNSTGCVFFAKNISSNTYATLWAPSKSDGGLGYGSTIYKAGRPSNPVTGEIGFNINTNNLEYYNGTVWRSINSSAV